jgi:hypothetical protein
MRLPSIEKLVENECLRVASIFGTDELSNRKLLIDIRHEGKFGEEYTCLGRAIPVEYILLEDTIKQTRLVRKDD